MAETSSSTIRAFLWPPERAHHRRPGAQWRRHGLLGRAGIASSLIDNNTAVGRRSAVGSPRRRRAPSRTGTVAARSPTRPSRSTTAPRIASGGNANRRDHARAHRRSPTTARAAGWSLPEPLASFTVKSSIVAATRRRVLQLRGRSRPSTAARTSSQRPTAPSRPAARSPNPGSPPRSHGRRACLPLLAGSPAHRPRRRLRHRDERSARDHAAAAGARAMRARSSTSRRCQPPTPDAHPDRVARRPRPRRPRPPRRRPTPVVNRTVVVGKVERDGARARARGHALRAAGRHPGHPGRLDGRRAQGRRRADVDPEGGRASRETAKFCDGIFKLTPVRAGSPRSRSPSRSRPAATNRRARRAKKKPKTRKLWGDGKGKFRTKGRYSAATVRGTKWLVQDSCATTRSRGSRRASSPCATSVKQANDHRAQGQVLHGAGRAAESWTIVGCCARPRLAV